MLQYGPLPGKRCLINVQLFPLHFLYCPLPFASSNVLQRQQKKDEGSSLSVTSAMPQHVAIGQIHVLFNVIGLTLTKDFSHLKNNFDMTKSVILQNKTGIGS